MHFCALQSYTILADEWRKMTMQDVMSKHIPGLVLVKWKTFNFLKLLNFDRDSFRCRPQKLDRKLDRIE